MLNTYYQKLRFLLHAYKYLNKYDKEEISYILKNLKPEDVGFDIGAHRGAYTYWMRKSIGRTGKVVSIEPQPMLYEYLTRMTSILDYENVILMDCAVSDKDGNGILTVPRKRGKASYGARIDDHKIATQFPVHYNINVRIRSVDSIIAETGFKPKIIKIDVEGHEFSVLKGMVKTLEEVRPRIIMECEARHIKNFTVFDVFNYLLDKNYAGYYLQAGEKNPLSQFDLNRDQLSFIEKNRKLDHNYINNFIFEPR